MLASLGKMPTTLARRLTSLVQSLQGVGGMDFQPVRRRELQWANTLRLGLIHQGGGFGKAGGVDRRPAAKQPGRWPRRVGRRSGAPRYRRVTGWSWARRPAGYAGNVLGTVAN